jgi:hypothetical protein
MADDETERLHDEQARRAAAERAQERATADEPAEAHAHRRRAAKAAYLRDKLTERAASEDAAAGEG